MPRNNTVYNTIYKISQFFKHDFFQYILISLEDLSISEKKIVSGFSDAFYNSKDIKASDNFDKWLHKNGSW